MKRTIEFEVPKGLKPCPICLEALKTDSCILHVRPKVEGIYCPQHDLVDLEKTEWEVVTVEAEDPETELRKSFGLGEARRR